MTEQQRSSPREYRDYPFDDVVAKAEAFAAAGHEVYQKFTCRGCGARLTIEPPNTFHESGTCDQCSAITNIRARGCNFMIVTRGP
jgi:ribosomal protein L40E